MTGNPWPAADENEPTPIYDGVLTKEQPVPEPTQTPDSGDVDPQEPGTVTGYRKHTQQEVDAVNTTKGIENDLGRWIQQLKADLPDVDGRWVSIAVTHFQQGFMALNRAVFKPDSEL